MPATHSLLSCMVERQCCDHQKASRAPVGEVEGLLDAVAVVHVDVDVQHPGVVLEQLQDGQHQIIHVAEARRLDTRLQGGMVLSRSCSVPTSRGWCYTCTYFCWLGGLPRAAAV